MVRLRALLLVGLGLFGAACCQSNDAVRTGDRKVLEPAPPATPRKTQADNELVQVLGRITNITPTGKRHQSYIFEFRVTHQLLGPGRGVVAQERVVRFELYQDFGGAELLKKLNVGADPTARLNVDDVVAKLPMSPRLQLVLWLIPPREDDETGSKGKRAAKVDSALMSVIEVLD